MPYYGNQPREYQSVVDPYIEGEAARQNVLLRRNQIEGADINQQIHRNTLNDYNTTRTVSNALAQNPNTSRDELLRQSTGNEGLASSIYQQQQKAQMDQVRQRVEPMVMTALTIGRNNKEEAYKVIYDALPVEIQKQAGLPETWNDTKLSQWLSPDNQAKVATYMEKIASPKGQAFEHLSSTRGFYSHDKTSPEGKAVPIRDEKGNILMPYQADVGLAGAKKQAQDQAAAGVKKEVGFPKARATFSAANRQWDFVGTQIDKAIDQINPFTAGMGAWAAVVPASPQKDLKETLESIKANIGFDKLAEMRANSPTGGALGQVSDFENKLLQAVQGSLQQNQSPGQLKNNLQTVKEMLAQVRDERSAAFEQDYGSIAQARPGAAPRGAAPAAAGRPLTATNPQTKQRIISRDGGKTWQPL